MASRLEDTIAEQRQHLAEMDATASARMRAIYQEQAEAVLRELELVTRQIERARAAGIDVHPDWLRRQGCYVRLLYQLDTLYSEFSVDGTHLLQQLALDGRQYGVLAGQQQMRAVGIDFGGRINVPATERFVASLDPSSPVRTVLEGYGAFARDVITKELVDGMALGRGPRDIAALIRRQLVDGAEARLDTLVRTELMRSYRGSLFDQYAGHCDEWTWTAAHSARTCLACLAMSGRRFPMTTPFMASHPNCRCCPTPVPRRLYVDLPPTGEEWFRSQPTATQRSMMPSAEAWAAFQDGRLGLFDFVGMRQDPLWGESVYQRSGVEALRSGR